MALHVVLGEFVHGEFATALRVVWLSAILVGVRLLYRGISSPTREAQDAQPSGEVCGRMGSERAAYAPAACLSAEPPASQYSDIVDELEQRGDGSMTGRCPVP